MSNSLHLDEWNAKWIWKSEKISQNDFSYFRKEISIKRKVLSAKVYVSAHNHYKLFVNGEQIGGFVSPASTNPEKSKYYIAYDITKSLKTGKNSICSIVHYIGGDGQNYMNGLPGFILQCQVTYSDNTLDCFITDDTWKALGKTPYKNGTDFQQDRKVSAIEDYDASLEDNSWLISGFDDSKWSKAVISKINELGWKLKKQYIPEGYIEETITPLPAKIQSIGLQVFDAGKIITGWPKIQLKGIKGAVIKMRYSEDICEDGRVKHNVCNEASENYYDVYRMKGAEEEVWRPDFSYKAFRYIEVTGYPEMIKCEEVKIEAAHTAIAYNGYFNSSNDLLNNIYDACIQTQKNNVLGQLVDCPHREQAQYLADSDLQAETLIYNFEAEEIIEKVLSDFKDSQFEDGRFPFIYPTNLQNKRFDKKIPEWDLHYCTLLWKRYYYYDDEKVLKKYYGTARSMVNYYINLIDKSTGLVPIGEGWHISDWPYPNIDGSGSYLTVQNCKLYHDINIMMDCTKILGYEEDYEFFNKTAIELKNSIVKHLYNKREKAFVDSFDSKEKHQGTNVIAYEYGLVPEEDKDALLKFILDQGFSCKTLLGLNLLKVLFENGQGDKAYRILNSTEYPGWGYMINKGYRTIWEGFDNKESHCHAWNAYPARLLVEYIAGIKPSKPGFKEIEVKPYMPEDLSFAEGRVHTVNGDVYASWNKHDDKFSVKLSIPQNVSAKLCVPAIFGKLHGEHEGIKFIEETGEIVIISLQSGEYCFDFKKIINANIII